MFRCRGLILLLVFAIFAMYKNPEFLIHCRRFRWCGTYDVGLPNCLWLVNGKGNTDHHAVAILVKLTGAVGANSASRMTSDVHFGLSIVKLWHALYEGKTCPGESGTTCMTLQGTARSQPPGERWVCKLEKSILLHDVEKKILSSRWKVQWGDKNYWLLHLPGEEAMPKRP